MSNPLYPIFLRLDRLNVLVAGEGEIAEEKLHFLNKNAPSGNITLLAEKITRETQDILDANQNIRWIQKDFDADLLKEYQVVIGAYESYDKNVDVYNAAKSANILVNVADTKDLCDFYMGGIVTRGDLKIAVSSNGKSPILVRRIREILEDTFPENTNELLLNLFAIRNKLSGTFRQKLDSLLKLTEILKTSEKEFKNN